MVKLELSLNSRQTSNADQSERELRNALDESFEDSLRRAAGPGVWLAGKPGGKTLEGPRDVIEGLRD